MYKAPTWVTVAGRCVYAVFTLFVGRRVGGSAAHTYMGKRKPAAIRPQRGHLTTPRVLAGAVAAVALAVGVTRQPAPPGGDAAAAAGAESTHEFSRAGHDASAGAASQQPELPSSTVRPGAAGCANVRADAECEAWAGAGHCSTNAGFMHVQCAKACASCAALDAVDASGRTPLVNAVLDDQAESVTSLLAAGAAVGAALHWACALGRRDAVRALLRGGAALEARDGEGKTPLIVAAMQGHAGVVSVLLEAGAEVEASDPYGNRALHVACYHGQTAVVRLLAAAGAAADAPDAQGVTAAEQVPLL
jgi:hypothetical protein